MGRRPPRARVAGRGRSPTQGAARTLGGEQVEGRRAVAELLRAGRRRVHDVWVAESPGPERPSERRAGPERPSERGAGPERPSERGAGPDEILRLAAAARVPVRRVPRGRLEAEARTEAPQGVLAHAEPLAEAEADDLCRPVPGRPPPFLLAVDGVTDPQNLGALLRTAEAAGVTGVLLPRHRAVHVTPAVAKAAAGAIERLPLAVVAGMPAALARARDLGCWIVGLAGEGDQSLFDLSLATEPVVVVVGAEGGGLSRLVRERCDVLVAIPMAGAVPSLNVAAAGALGLFEVARRRQSAV